MRRENSTTVRFLRRGMFALRRALWRPFRALIHSGTMTPAARVTMLGIDVYLSEEELGEGIARDTALNTIGEALQLVNLYDARCLRRMRGDGVRILVRRTPTSGQLAGSSTVLVAASVVERGDAAMIAGTLVHEATHVRLERSGIEPWPDLRTRIERRCLIEQIALLKRIPDRADLVTYYRTWIDRIWWTPEQRFAGRVRYLEEIGAPAWVTRLYTVLLKPRSLT